MVGGTLLPQREIYKLLLSKIFEKAPLENQMEFSKMFDNKNNTVFNKTATSCVYRVPTSKTKCV